MNRRQFLAAASATWAAAVFPSAWFGRKAFSRATSISLNIDLERSLGTMPLDFVGFSYESPQLADPTFFSDSNTSLVERYRKLSNRGVLRLGGDLSDVTLWSSGSKAASVPAHPEKLRTRFEWMLVGRQAGQARPATITPDSIRALGSFLKATSWGLLYGLNLGTGTPQRAAEEAACVMENAGDHLVAFQVGNEADFFGSSFRRGSSWGFDRYWTEYQAYVKAVRARVPRAPFAGPDVAVRTDWVIHFAERVKDDAVLLSSHYYAMGPAGNPRMNAHRLLRRDPRLERELPKLVAAAKAAGLPYRMTEGNSCSHGGRPGVSNTFVSALWGANYMLFTAQAGCQGVNFHGGGEGVYSALVGEPPHITERPLFVGMQFAQRFAGATFVPAALATNGRNLAAYAARRGPELLLAIINKDSVPVTIQVTGLPADAKRLKENWTLTAPTPDATEGVQLQPAYQQDTLTMLGIPQYSGRLIVLNL